MQIAATIVLIEGKRKKLTQLAKSHTASIRMARRAQIVLLAAAGQRNDAIVEAPGIGRGQVGRWRERYAAGGLAAIGFDLPRGGRPPSRRRGGGATDHTDAARGGYALEHAPGGEGWRERHDAVRRAQHTGRFAHRLLPTASPP